MEVRGWAASAGRLEEELALGRQRLGKAILKLDSRVLDINLKSQTHTEVCILILCLHNIFWMVSLLLPYTELKGELSKYINTSVASI